MSFLADPPILMGIGAAVEELGLDEDEIGRVKRVTLAVFYVVSVALWFDLGWIRWWGKAFGGRSGTDFMLNSGWVSLRMLRFDPENKSLRRHLVAALIFASYPLFFELGRELRRKAAAR